MLIPHFWRLSAALFAFQLTLAHADPVLLKADRVFDGEQLHDNWGVIVDGNKILQTGALPQLNTQGMQVIDLSDQTLMPGMIEGHSHILLHPYDETDWNDQVLKEDRALRVARAVNHVRASLLAGFTTLRDLGTEGAGYADNGIKQAIEQGIIPGSRLLIASRAIVATGSYGPRGFDSNFDVPLGAEEADGNNIIQVVRDQIGHGADIVKVYVDAGWGPNHEYLPTFSQQELTLLVTTAHSSGRIVAAHSHSEEGMRRAILAGVDTIEHGLRGGSEEIYQLMVSHNVTLCPTLAATESISGYQGWDKARDPMPDNVRRQHQMFTLARNTGVRICNGSDVGVFDHGDNAIEPILMAEYGMPTLDVLRAATSVNADAFAVSNKIGRLQPGLLADIIAATGNPLDDIRRLQQVSFVMKNGVIYKLNNQPQNLL